MYPPKQNKFKKIYGDNSNNYLICGCSALSKRHRLNNVATILPQQTAVECELLKVVQQTLSKCLYGKL
jgi:hypothetical protein